VARRTASAKGFRVLRVTWTDAPSDASTAHGHGDEDGRA
jgi:hypothetical protein